MDIVYTTRQVPFNDKALNGGLNSTSGPLGLQNNESSDLQNIDFNKFGSILKRSGYTLVNATPTNGTTTSYGLHWYEYDNAGTTARKLVNVTDGKVYKMDDLDGNWDDITGVVTITNAYCDFTNWLNQSFVTNGADAPFKLSGTSNAALFASTPANLQWAKYNEEFNNYLFLGNIKLNNLYYPSRIYWSNIKDPGSWSATNFIDVARDDGQEITRIKALGDRLVVYKTRSIYNVYFSGNADFPFTLPGGGKSNSVVGCVAPWSIQEVDNGHVFLSYDGFYFYDGLNTYKISDRVTNTILNFKESEFVNSQSMVQKSKNRYWCSFVNSGASQASNVMVWDYFNNAWSIYAGMSPSNMTVTYVDGVEERPYWADYEGWAYRSDTGDDDYPRGTETAIQAYYYTNWKNYEDLSDKKGIPHLILYHRIDSTTLTFAYSYDFDEDDQYSQTIDLATSSDVYGVGRYGTAVYAGEGGRVIRRDMTGRGYVVRFKFENGNAGEEFRIDGFGTLPYLETEQ